MKLLKLLFAFALLTSLLIYWRWQVADETVREIVATTTHVKSPAQLASKDLTPTRSPKTQSDKPIVTTTELPAYNTPLKEIYEPLKKRVQQNDAKAACRLAEELFRCGYLLPERKKLISQLQQEAESTKLNNSTPLKWQERLNAYRAEDEIDQVVCKGYEEYDEIEAWRFKFVAALNGHINSMEDFATRPYWNPNDLNANIDAWKAFQDYRETFLRQAASAGSASAALTLIEEFSGDSSIMRGPLAPLSKIRVDFRQAAKYAYVYNLISRSDAGNNHYVNRALQQAARQITPQDLTIAKQEADQLFKSWGSDYLQKRGASFQQQKKQVGANCNNQL
jgi:hypothetical protein